MSSTSEVGHAKNVANLQKITQQIATFNLYNPPVDELKISNLEALHNDANAKLTEVGNKRSLNKNAIVARQTAFEKLNTTCTSIINLLEVMGLPQGTITQVQSLTKTIRGDYKKSQPTGEPGGEAPNTSSTSRQSYTSRTENFGLLIQMLSTLPAYAPNEEDIKLNNLTTYHDSLEAATLLVDQTESELNSKMIERDKMLYAENTGVYDIAIKIKKYVKSLYGSTSPEFTTVSGIKFTNIRQ